MARNQQEMFFELPPGPHTENAMNIFKSAKIEELPKTTSKLLGEDEAFFKEIDGRLESSRWITPVHARYKELTKKPEMNIVNILERDEELKALAKELKEAGKQDDADLLAQQKERRALLVNKWADETYPLFQMLALALSPYNLAVHKAVNIERSGILTFAYESTQPDFVLSAMALQIQERTSKMVGPIDWHGSHENNWGRRLLAIAFGWGSAVSMMKILEAYENATHNNDRTLFDECVAAIQEDLDAATESADQDMGNNSEEKGDKKNAKSSVVERLDFLRRVVDPLLASPTSLLKWARCRLLSLIVIGKDAALLNDVMDSFATEFYREILTDFENCVERLALHDDGNCVALLGDLLLTWAHLASHFPSPVTSGSSNTHWHKMLRLLPGITKGLASQHTNFTAYTPWKQLNDITISFVRQRQEGALLRMPGQNNSHQEATRLRDSLVAMHCELLESHPDLHAGFILNTLIPVEGNTPMQHMAQRMERGYVQVALENGVVASASKLARRLLSSALVTNRAAPELTQSEAVLLQGLMDMLRSVCTVSVHHTANPASWLLSPGEEGMEELATALIDFAKGALRRHPTIVANSFALFAASVHHNVRDVTPALLERGLLDFTLHIVDRFNLDSDPQCLLLGLPMLWQALSVHSDSHETLSSADALSAARKIVSCVGCSSGITTGQSVASPTQPGSPTMSASARFLSAHLEPNQTDIFAQFGSDIFSLGRSSEELRCELLGAVPEIVDDLSKRVDALAEDFRLWSESWREAYGNPPTMALSPLSDVAGSSINRPLVCLMALLGGGARSIPVPGNHGRRPTDPTTDTTTKELQIISTDDRFTNGLVNIFTFLLNHQQLTQPPRLVAGFLKCLGLVDFARVWTVVMAFAADAVKAIQDKGFVPEVMPSIQTMVYLSSMCSALDGTGRREHVPPAKERLMRILWDGFFAVQALVEDHDAKEKEKKQAKAKKDENDNDESKAADVEGDDEKKEEERATPADVESEAANNDEKQNEFVPDLTHAREFLNVCDEMLTALTANRNRFHPHGGGAMNGDFTDELFMHARHNNNGSETLSFCGGIVEGTMPLIVDDLKKLQMAAQRLKMVEKLLISLSKTPVVSHIPVPSLTESYNGWLQIFKKTVDIRKKAGLLNTSAVATGEEEKFPALAHSEHPMFEGTLFSTKKGIPTPFDFKAFESPLDKATTSIVCSVAIAFQVYLSNPRIVRDSSKRRCAVEFVSIMLNDWPVQTPKTIMSTITCFSMIIREVATSLRGSHFSSIGGSPQRMTPSRMSGRLPPPGPPTGSPFTHQFARQDAGRSPISYGWRTPTRPGEATPNPQHPADPMDVEIIVGHGFTENQARYALQQSENRIGDAIQLLEHTSVADLDTIDSQFNSSNALRGSLFGADDGEEQTAKDEEEAKKAAKKKKKRNPLFAFSTDASTPEERLHEDGLKHITAILRWVSLVVDKANKMGFFVPASTNLDKETIDKMIFYADPKEKDAATSYTGREKRKLADIFAGIEQQCMTSINNFQLSTPANKIRTFGFLTQGIMTFHPARVPEMVATLAVLLTQRGASSLRAEVAGSTAFCRLVSGLVMDCIKNEKFLPPEKRIATLYSWVFFLSAFASDVKGGPKLGSEDIKNADGTPRAPPQTCADYQHGFCYRGHRCEDIHHEHASRRPRTDDATERDIIAEINKIVGETYNYIVKRQATSADNDTPSSSTAQGHEALVRDVAGFQRSFGENGFSPAAAGASSRNRSAGNTPRHQQNDPLSLPTITNHNTTNNASTATSVLVGQQTSILDQATITDIIPHLLDCLFWSTLFPTEITKELPRTCSIVLLQVVPTSIEAPKILMSKLAEMHADPPHDYGHDVTLINLVQIMRRWPTMASNLLRVCLEDYDASIWSVYSSMRKTVASLTKESMEQQKNGGESFHVQLTDSQVEQLKKRATEDPKMVCETPAVTSLPAGAISPAMLGGLQPPSGNNSFSLEQQTTVPNNTFVSPSGGATAEAAPAASDPAASSSATTPDPHTVAVDLMEFVRDMESVRQKHPTVFHFCMQTSCTVVQADPKNPVATREKMVWLAPRKPPVSSPARKELKATVTTCLTEVTNGIINITNLGKRIAAGDEENEDVATLNKTTFRVSSEFWLKVLTAILNLPNVMSAVTGGKIVNDPMRTPPSTSLPLADGASGMRTPNSFGISPGSAFALGGGNNPEFVYNLVPLVRAVVALTPPQGVPRATVFSGKGAILSQLASRSPSLVVDEIIATMTEQLAHLENNNGTSKPAKNIFVEGGAEQSNSTLTDRDAVSVINTFPAEDVLAGHLRSLELIAKQSAKKLKTIDSIAQSSTGHVLMHLATSIKKWTPTLINSLLNVLLIYTTPSNISGKGAGAGGVSATGGIGAGEEPSMLHGMIEHETHDDMEVEGVGLQMNRHGGGAPNNHHEEEVVDDEDEDLLGGDGGGAPPLNVEDDEDDDVDGGDDHTSSDDGEDDDVMNQEQDFDEEEYDTTDDEEEDGYVVEDGWGDNNHNNHFVDDDDEGGLLGRPNHTPANLLGRMQPRAGGGHTLTLDSPEEVQQLQDLLARGNHEDIGQLLREHLLNPLHNALARPHHQRGGVRHQLFGAGGGNTSAVNPEEVFGAVMDARQGAVVTLEDNHQSASASAAAQEVNRFPPFGGRHGHSDVDWAQDLLPTFSRPPGGEGPPLQDPARVRHDVLLTDRNVEDRTPSQQRASMLLPPSGGGGNSGRSVPPPPPHPASPPASGGRPTPHGNATTTAVVDSNLNASSATNNSLNEPPVAVSPLSRENTMRPPPSPGGALGMDTFRMALGTLGGQQQSRAQEIEALFALSGAGAVAAANNTAQSSPALSTNIQPEPIEQSNEEEHDGDQHHEQQEEFEASSVDDDEEEEFEEEEYESDWEEDEPDIIPNDGPHHGDDDSSDSATSAELGQADQQQAALMDAAAAYTAGLFGGVPEAMQQAHNEPQEPQHNDDVANDDDDDMDAMLMEALRLSALEEEERQAAAAAAAANTTSGADTAVHVDPQAEAAPADVPAAAPSGDQPEAPTTTTTNAEPNTTELPTATTEAPPAAAAAATDERVPWQDALDPLFLAELPEDLRRDILREHFPIITRHNTHNIGEGDAARPTHFHPLFMAAVPDSLHEELLRVEREFLAAGIAQLPPAPVPEGQAPAANDNTTTGPASAGASPQAANNTSAASGGGGGGGGAAPAMNETAMLLASVGPELREEILLTCDLQELQSDPALLREAETLRARHEQRSQERMRQMREQIENSAPRHSGGRPPPPPYEDGGHLPNPFHEMLAGGRGGGGGGGLNQLYGGLPHHNHRARRNRENTANKNARKIPAPTSIDCSVPQHIASMDHLPKLVAEFLNTSNVQFTLISSILGNLCRSLESARVVIEAILDVASKPITEFGVELNKPFATELKRDGLKAGHRPQLETVSRCLQCLSSLLKRNHWAVIAFTRCQVTSEQAPLPAQAVTAPVAEESNDTSTNKVVAANEEGVTPAKQTTAEQQQDDKKTPGVSPIGRSPTGAVPPPPDQPRPSDEELLVMERSPLARLIILMNEYHRYHNIQQAFTEFMERYSSIMKRFVAKDEPLTKHAPDHVEGAETLDHPRHVHQLQWLDPVRADARYHRAPFTCNLCGVSSTFMCFHCEGCTFDCCQHCGFDLVTEATQQLRNERFHLLLLEQTDFMQQTISLLRSAECSAEIGAKMISLVHEGVSVIPKVEGLPWYEGRAMGEIEAALVDVAQKMTRELADVLRNFDRSPGGGASALAPDGSPMKAPSPGDATRDVLARRMASLEVPVQALGNQLYRLFQIHGVSGRAQPSEVRRMWHAVQRYLAEVNHLLNQASDRNAIPLPAVVQKLIVGYCQYYLLAGRGGDRSASALERTDTERLLGEDLSPSEVSNKASAKAFRNDQKKMLGSAGAGRAHDIYEDDPFDISPDMRRAMGIADPASPVRPAPSVAAYSEQDKLPATVLKFVEANKACINSIIFWDRKTLTSELSFMMRAPRLLDFNFKMKEFRDKLDRFRNRGSQMNLNMTRAGRFTESFFALRNRDVRDLMGPIQIKFQGEEGIDAGGLMREWFQLLAEDIVNSDFALFIHSSEGMTFQPNPDSAINTEHLSYFRFVGRIIGLAVYHEVPLDIHFTRSVYRHLIGVEPVFKDLASIDPDLFQNMEKLLSIDLDEVDLGLDFTITHESFGQMEEIELVPGGKDIPVTNANKKEFIRKRCANRMTGMIEEQLHALLNGFYDVIPRQLISVFTEQELELVISGMPEIDVEDLRVNTDYQGYSASSPQIRWFWECVSGMTKEDRANLLQFTTGASKVPPGGFSNLEGMSGKTRFTVVRSETSTDNLPVAHTCFNRIDLPPYPSGEVLREKLHLAISYGNKGFSLV